MRMSSLGLGIVLLVLAGCAGDRNQSPVGSRNSGGAAGSTDATALQRPVEGYAVISEGAVTPFAENRAQRLTTTFAHDSVRFRSVNVDSRFEVGLRLAAFGFDRELSPVDSSTGMEVRGARVQYLRHNANGQNVREWFDNRPTGVEQGFTLDHDGDEAPASVQVQLAVGGDLRAQLSTDGLAIAFVGLDGARRASYDALHAFDADGKALPSHFELSGGDILIHVDTAGARFPVTIDPTMWVFSEQLQGSSVDQDDVFGVNIAIDGDVAVIGAPGATNNTGMVYVYARENGVWTQTNRLTASGGASPDLYGWSVAIDGDRIVVGAPGTAQGLLSVDYQGAIHVYDRNGDTWSLRDTLDIGGGLNTQLFGQSVAIDGDTIVAGASALEEVHIFTENGNSWDTSSISINGADELGFDVDIEGDTLVVGAPSAEAGAASSAYVYERDGGGNWDGGTDITPGGLADGDRFGFAVDLEPLRLVIGAPGDANDAGAVYIFERAQVGDAFALVNTERASDAETGAEFGYSVALSGDAILVGAPSDSGDGSFTAPGTVYGLHLDQAAWVQNQIASSDPEDNELMGFAVELDGIVGMIGRVDHSDPGIHAGAVQVETLTGTLALGDACATDGECDSDFCIDGICCESDCGGGDPNDCQSCIDMGACTPVVVDTLCRAVAGVCDVEEVCNGVDAECPADGVVADGAQDCRDASDVCDAVETCDGAGVDCPADELEPEGVVCNPADPGEPCDTDDLCDGRGDYCRPLVADAGTVCAAADGALPCDVDDVCDGTTLNCEPLLAAAGVVCRTADPGVACDGLDTCDGLSGDCIDVVAPQGTLCRPADPGLACDAPEECDGVASDCPAEDWMQPQGVVCRPARAGFPCDSVEVCAGDSFVCPADALSPALAGTVCREAASPCDAAEVCDGGATTCPIDAQLAAGDPCADDLDACTSDMCNANGQCEHVAVAGCCNANDECDDGDMCTSDTCSGPGGTCSHADNGSCSATGGMMGTGGAAAGDEDGGTTDPTGTGGTMDTADSGAGGAMGTGGINGTGGVSGSGGIPETTYTEPDAGIGGKGDDGCGCRTVGTTTRGETPALSLLGLGMLLLVRGRRRRA